jgi:hypothetical protein
METGVDGKIGFLAGTGLPRSFPFPVWPVAGQEKRKRAIQYGFYLLSEDRKGNEGYGECG